MAARYEKSLKGGQEKFCAAGFLTPQSQQDHINHTLIQQVLVGMLTHHEHKATLISIPGRPPMSEIRDPWISSHLLSN